MSLKRPPLVNRNRRPSSACPPKQAKREGGSTGLPSADRITITVDPERASASGRITIGNHHTHTLPYSPQPPTPTPKGGPAYERVKPR